MRRLAALLLAPVLLLAVTGCDRTDQDFGDHGVVHIGFAPDDLLVDFGGSELVLGHAKGDTAVTVSKVANDGATTWTTRLPTSFAALQARGALLPPYVYVVGDSYAAGPGEDLEIVRLRADTGAIDESWGDDGIASTGLGWSVSMDPVIVGWGQTTSPAAVFVGGEGISIARFTTTGALDPSWGGGDGVATVSTSITPEDVVVVSDGSLVLGGTVVRSASRGIPTDSDLAVARVTRDGALDTSFGGGDGIATISVNAVDSGSSIAAEVIDGEVRIVLAGTTWHDGRSQLVLAGIDGAGQPDGWFGLYGLSIVDFAPSGASLTAGGPGWVVATSSYGRVVTLGFKQRGAVEPSWGDEGVQVNDVGGSAGPVGIVRSSVGSRFVVAARSDDGELGALLGLKP
jgi:uncharacterized delta-60 repeat protein